MGRPGLDGAISGRQLAGKGSAAEPCDQESPQSDIPRAQARKWFRCVPCLEDKAGGGSELSSRDLDTYSFVPNLVWLPTQVAKLTDREGSFAQAYLQALSSKIYNRLQVPHQFSSLVK